MPCPYTELSCRSRSLPTCLDYYPVNTGIGNFCRCTGEGLLEHGLDRHEQLKLQAPKQGLLEGSAPKLHPRMDLPACIVDTADDSGDEQDDLDALIY